MTAPKPEDRKREDRVRRGFAQQGMFVVKITNRDCFCYGRRETPETAIAMFLTLSDLERILAGLRADKRARRGKQIHGG